MKFALLTPRWRWIFHTIFEEFQQFINRPEITFDIIHTREIQKRLRDYDWIVSPIKFQKTYENTLFKKELRDRFIGFVGGNECYDRITDWSIFKHVWILSQGLVRPELECTNYFVQPNGVDTHLFHPMNLDKEWFVGFIGNAGNPRKRIRDWFKPICQRADVSYYLHNGQTHYLPRSALPSLYNRFRCYMNTAMWEGGCNPILEAAACGLPIVATDTGFIRDFGDLAFRCHTLQEMVHALVTLKEDADLQRRMGQRLRRLMVEEWSVEQRAEEWISTVEAL